MKKTYILILTLVYALATPSKEYVDQLAINELGQTLLTEVQIEMNSSNQNHLYQIVQLFNQMEKDIDQEAQQDKESLDQNAEHMNQQLEELQQSIFASQYKISFSNDQINSIQEDIAREEIRLEEKTDNIRSYANVLQELESIRNDENSKYELIRDSILKSVSVVKRCKYLISQLLPRKQNSFLETNEQTNIINEIKKTLDDELDNENVYKKIIVELVQGPVNVEEVNGIVEVLSQLYDDLMTMNSNMFNANNERQENFDDLKDSCDGDVELWEQQSEEIEVRISGYNEKIGEMEELIKEESEKMEEQKNQEQDLQKMLEDEKIDYNIRRKGREEYLEMISKLKKVLQDDFESVSSYIMEKQL